jgi:dTDP-4-amino-4,6-dideoxygalactose transaminase
MSATAAAILHWSGVPVFGDIDAATFNLDPATVEPLITDRTRAIVAADIFGQSANVVALRRIADHHGLILISDTAQAPGAMTHGRFAGTVGHIGGFSLNYHKHIQTGEGGIIVTDDDVLADRLRLIRNHAEAVVATREISDLTNLVGHNFRLGEIECAIGTQQLKRLPELVASRQQQVAKFDELVHELPGLRLPQIDVGNTHVYYLYALTVDQEITGASRDAIHQALTAEGVPLLRQYQNLHLLPTFQEKRAFGRGNFPWDYHGEPERYDYAKGTCPVAEAANDHTFMGFEICRFDLTDQNFSQIGEAFMKVWTNLEAIQSQPDA